MKSTSRRGLQVVLFALFLLVTVVVFFVRRFSVGGSRTVRMQALLSGGGRKERGVLAARALLFLRYWHFIIRAVERNGTLAVRERLCVGLVIRSGRVRSVWGICGLVVSLL